MSTGRIRGAKGREEGEAAGDGTFQGGQETETAEITPAYKMSDRNDNKWEEWMRRGEATGRRREGTRGAVTMRGVQTTLNRTKVFEGGGTTSGNDRRTTSHRVRLRKGQGTNRDKEDRAHGGLSSQTG